MGLPDDIAAAKWPAAAIKEIKFSKDINTLLAAVKKLEAMDAAVQWDVLDRQKVYANPAGVPHALIEQGYKAAAAEVQKVILSLKKEAEDVSKLAAAFAKEADTFLKDYKAKAAKKLIPGASKVKEIEKADAYLKGLTQHAADYSADAVADANAKIADWVDVMHAAEARDAAGHAPVAPGRPAAGPVHPAPAAPPHAAAPAHAAPAAHPAPPPTRTPAAPPPPPRPATGPARTAAPAGPQAPARPASGPVRPGAPAKP